MFYNITRPLARIALSIFFRKIYIFNRECIPKNGPVIFACNHPTAFLDPCLLACFQERHLHFLARGDYYKTNPFLRRIYDAYGMIPVFRQEDAGYSGLKTNFESFDKTFDALQANKAIMVLAEGRTLYEKRLRPIRKGTARIVLGAREKHGDLDIYIVPVGFNYTDSDRFRSEIMIDFQEPIRVRDYAEPAEENQARAVNALTSEIRARLLKSVIHIENNRDDDFAWPLLEMRHNERKSPFWPALIEDRTPYLDGKEVADTVNNLNESQRSELKQKVERYFSKLQKAGITDRGLTDHTSYGMQGALVLGLGWFPSVFGYLLNVLPIKPAAALAKKLAPSIEFRSSMIAVFSSFTWLIYWLIWVIAALFSKSLWIWIFVGLIPILGYFHVYYRDIEARWKACKDVALLEDDQVEELTKLRERIMQSFRNVGSLNH